MGFVNDRSEEPWKTIDREREITLINTGVSQDGEWFFSLDIKGKKNRFDAIRGSEITQNKLLNISWKIIRMSAAKGDQSVKKIITEGLEAHGNIYSHELVQSIKVEFLI